MYALSPITIAFIANIGTFFDKVELTGSPVVVVPLTHSIEGLPIGVQIVGKRWDEAKLLSIAGKVSEVVGAYQMPPGYYP